MKQIIFTIPIRTISEANCVENWAVQRKRHRFQQTVTRLAYNKYVQKISLPCQVILTRVSQRKLDEDNLVSSMKWIRDEISECILPEYRGFYVTRGGKIIPKKGRADSDERIIWKYTQEIITKSFPIVKVTIEFEE